MKKIVSIMLVAFMLFALVPFSALNVSAAWTIRNSKPTSSDPAWPYYSAPINTYPLSPYNGGNCTWYAYGRAYEVHGFDSGMSGKGNACYWYWAAYHNSPWQVDQNPAPGAIVCWDGTYGHVGFVERVNSDGTVTWTQSNYAEAGQNYSPFEIKTGHPEEYATGSLTFQGYIHVGTPKGSTPSTPSTSYENISPGTYAIKNNNTGTYMCVSYGIDNNAQNVDMYSEINVASRMVISKASTGYKIRPECCASRIINPYGYTVTSGLNVNIYNDENDSSQWWQFQKVSGGYVIRNVQNPNCVLDIDGSNVYVSTYSGASTQIWSLVSNHTHSYGSWKVRKAATCTSGGTEYRTCSCGAEETRTTSALGHNYTSVITNPTCTSGGYTTYTCSRCYNSYTGNNTSAKGHSYGSWKARKAATCTSGGTEYRTCSCGAEETRTTSSLGHNYTSVTTNPTCTSGGYTTYTCSRCYNSYTGNNTSAKGHSYGSWKVRKAATCTANGTEYRTCSCGAEETRSTSVLGHNYTSVTTNPTCTSGGYTTYTCSRCYNSYTGNNTSAKGHTAGDWVVVKEADFGVAGLKIQSCKTCGTVLNRQTIPAPKYSRGDANMDGKVDYFDYMMVRRYCMKTYELSDEQLIYADADGSGNVDFFDYMMIRRHCMGTYVIK